MSFSIPTIKSLKPLSSGPPPFSYLNFCNSFGGASQPDYFLINGSPPGGGPYFTSVDVTFLYTSDLAYFIANNPNATEVHYEWSRGGPMCPNISGSGVLTGNTTVTIPNPCDDDQTVDLFIKVYNASGWVGGTCCTPYGALCSSLTAESVQAAYSFDLSP